MLRLRNRLAHGDDGIAMLFTLFIIVIATGLIVVAVSFSLNNLQGATGQRERVQALPVAEAGVDLAYESIQNGTLYCLLNNSTNPFSTQPATGTYTTTVTYYDASGSQLGCSNGVVSGTPAKALITSTGTVTGTTGGSRTMASLVTLNPQSAAGSAFDKAIYSHDTLKFSNTATITGHNGDDADVYSNSNYSCTNRTTIYGSLLVQGTITGTNVCSTHVDTWGKGDVKLANNSVVGHGVYSSQGNVNLSSVTVGSPGAQAKLTASCSAMTPSNAPCLSHATGITDPPTESFPQYSPSTTDFTNAGYTIVNTTNCTTVTNTITAMATALQPTAIFTNCVINLSGTFTLNKSLAIITTGGINDTHALSFVTPNGDNATRSLHLVVPFSTTGTTDCASPPFTMTNTFSTPSNILTFMYSPCDMTINNNNVQNGQVYGGGNVTITNTFNMGYYPMNVPGAPNSSTSTSYAVNIVYEREIATP